MPFLFRTILLSVWLTSCLPVCLSQQPKLMLPVGHRGNIIDARFSPDGNKIFTNGVDNTYKIWDAFTGTLLYDLNLFEKQEPNQFLITPVQFSPDNRMFLSVLKTNLIEEYYPTDQNEDIRKGKYIKDTFKIWNALTGKLIFKQAGNGISRFSRDNKMIAIAAHPDITKIFNLANGKLMATLRANGQKHVLDTWWENNIIEFSPDGKKIIALSDNWRIGLWDIQTSKYQLMDSLSFGCGENSTLSATFTPDSKMVCCFKIFTENNGPDTMKIINAETGTLKHIIPVYLKENAFPVLSPDGKYIIINANLKSNSNEGIAHIYDTETGKEIPVLPGQNERCQAVFFSPDNTAVAYVISDSMIMIKGKDAAGRLLRLQGQGGFLKVEFSRDGKKIMAVCSDSTIKTWDTGNGKLLAHFKLPGYPDDDMNKMPEPMISPESGKIISFSAGGEAQVWSTVTGKQLSVLKGHTNAFVARFNAEGNKIILANDSIEKEWDLNSGVVINLPAGSVKAAERISPILTNRAILSPDRKKILYFDKFADNNDECASITIYKNESLKNGNIDWYYPPENQKILGRINGHTDWIISGQFSPDGKYILTSSQDYTVKLWDANNYQLVFTLVTIDSADYLIQAASGYYQCTPNAAKMLHYITSGQQSIGFEQLDIKYNRPDKIFDAMGYSDTAMISTYRNAYYKRIKKLGIDTTAFRDGYSLPVANIENRDSITRETGNETLVLHIKGNDKAYRLRSFNVWVNEVPLYGMRGVSLLYNKSGNFDSTVVITLAQGDNRIETSVTNTNGTESYRVPLMVKYMPAEKKKEKVYFIGIGIDQFRDSSHNLHYCTKDIRDLSQKMKSKFKDDITIHCLYNEDVTVEKIKALKQILLQSTVNDKVIISYSGHGLLSKSYDYYLSTFDVNFNDPQVNGLPYEELENLLDSIPARRKLLLIDACHSGEIDKSDYRNAGGNNVSLESNHVVTKGVIVTNTDSSNAKIGLINSFELMQHIFVNVGKGTGATVISAAAGTEYALEKGDLKNGVFTYCVMDAMEQYPSMKISDLRKIVGARVEELTGGRQRPTSRNEVISVNWELW